MVTNLPAKAKAIWAKAMMAKEPEEKLELLKQFYSSFPKHKATERLEVQIKRQIKKLEEEIENKKKKHGKVINIWSVKKEGDIQVTILGTFYDTLEFFEKVIGLKVDQFDVYTRPQIGTLKIDSILLQILLCPFDKSIGEEKQKKFSNLLYNADLFLIILPKTNYASYFNELISWLEQNNIIINARKKEVKIERTTEGGIRIVGKSKFITEEEIKNFLREYNIVNGIIKVSIETTLEDLETAIFGQVSKPAIILCNNIEQEKEIKKYYTGICNLNIFFEKKEFLKKILEILGIIRIYTRRKDGIVAERPLLIEKGKAVIDVAKIIHKEMAKNFQYAKLNRNGEELKVGRYFILEDGDIVEIRSR
ncbi:MAG: TGS domain-containing protein [Nitrososphaeria archaeon]|nr:TGS domain-containing protein [Nitrososphaeria archaeon]